MRNLIKATLISLPLVVGTAAAGPNLFGGVQYLDFEDAAYTAIGGRAGVSVFGPLGVEAEAFFGVTGDTQDVVETNIDFTIDSSLTLQIGAYATAAFGVAPNAKAGARVGIVDVEIEATALGETATESETGTAIGAFVVFSADQLPVDIRADFGRLLIDDLEATTLSLSVGLSF